MNTTQLPSIASRSQLPPATARRSTWQSNVHHSNLAQSHRPHFEQLIEQVADQVAQESVLADYRRGKEPKTLRRQRTDLDLFETFLAGAGAPTTNLSDDLALWAEISPGLVKAFVRWQLARGYRIGSVNVRLSTVKRYTQLAAEAGYVPAERAQLIELVHGISHKEGRNIDAGRERTSVGAKKAEPTRISPTHVALLRQLLQAEATHPGRVDAQPESSSAFVQTNETIPDLE